MLIFDLRTIGNNLYQARKAKGLTQAETAEKADLSDRAYADIERGSVTMRIDTLLKICLALNITPNDIFVTDDTFDFDEENIITALKNCSTIERTTALKLLSTYINSLK